MMKTGFRDHETQIADNKKVLCRFPWSRCMQTAWDMSRRGWTTLGIVNRLNDLQRATTQASLRLLQYSFWCRKIILGPACAATTTGSFGSGSSLNCCLRYEHSMTSAKLFTCEMSIAAIVIKAKMMPDSQTLAEISESKFWFCGKYKMRSQHFKFTLQAVINVFINRILFNSDNLISQILKQKCFKVCVNRSFTEQNWTLFG